MPAGDFVFLFREDMPPKINKTSSAMGLGSDFNNVLEYGGELYGLIVIIKQAQNGDWWLMVNDENNTVGYLPKSLFNLLSDDASFVAYGGEAGGPSNEPLPPMGNGHFPEGGDLTKEGYISNMKVNLTKEGYIRLQNVHIRAVIFRHVDSV